MDAERFDDIIRSLSSDASRRRLISTMVSGLVAALATDVLGPDADGVLARRRKRKTTQQNHGHQRDRLHATRKKGNKKGKKKKKNGVQSPPPVGALPAPPCVPQCAATKPCGPDSCGGSCGTCTPPETCPNGTCVCVPDCTGKACGDNGCGGSCGSCSGTNFVCNTSGQCVCFGTPCGANCCNNASQVCSGTTCVACGSLGATCTTQADCCLPATRDCVDPPGGATGKICCRKSGVTCANGQDALCCSGVCSITSGAGQCQ
jgi:hypothetical protein